MPTVKTGVAPSTISKSSLSAIFTAPVDSLSSASSLPVETRTLIVPLPPLQVASFTPPPPPPPPPGPPLPPTPPVQFDPPLVPFCPFRSTVPAILTSPFTRITAGGEPRLPAGGPPRGALLGGRG